jgi:hypothetical protein
LLEAVAKSHAGFSGVVAVVAHAQPAELVLALATRHMHAALILFDHALAIGARFGVEFYPKVRIFIRIAHPVQPLLQRLAVQRLMGRLAALEARHLVAIFAIEVKQLVRGVLLADSVAVHSGTILQELWLFHHVALALQVLVLLKLVGGQKRLEDALRDWQFAAARTWGFDNFDAFGQLEL